MSKYLIEESTLTSIADAIRTKEGTTDSIPVSDFATRIGAITTGSTSNSLTVRYTLDSNTQVDTSTGSLVINPPADVELGTISSVENFSVRLFLADSTNKKARDMLITNVVTSHYSARYIHIMWSGTSTSSLGMDTIEEIDSAHAYVSFDENTKVLTLTPYKDYLTSYSGANIYCTITYLIS